MKRSLFILMLLYACFCGISASAQTTAENQIPQPLDAEKDLIHFGDTIDIDVVGSVEYDWRGTISPEGFLSGLDFVDEPVFAQCKSESEIADAVAKGYSKLLRDPKVVVKVIDRSRRPVSTMFGAIKKEQRFQIQRPVSLSELIILSGGLTDRASGEIQIFRPKNISCVEVVQKEIKTETDENANRERFLQASQPGGSETINIKISDILKGKENANPKIYSGDIITIMEAEPIYIIGGVAAPKRIPSRNQTTLSRAIAGAGGFSKDSEPKSITIFRRDGKETKIIEANFDEIEKDAAKDILLQAFDVVDVGVKGRGKNKVAPIVREEEFSSKNNSNLPLKIID